ncbi:hypothetical protein [Amycolatopsis sp. PS_44_ISF1]|uniref:hypothetical protein n=1 Tax=Amycolatopsis sp. PS_44_ISF1 TaxID=2974917 RepID=UPI0028DE526C|nr:hypothetical protein [Amycolatopsis sp. PS_44_ISF1]MDT8913423.1 hypothetical protein [Amycolatopsis sp. PS_44_ISF1]
MVRIPDQAWPSTVVPGDGHERAQATGVLFRRMGWVTERLTRDEREAVERQLEFWYGNGYCPDALLLALSALPDGTRQRPRGARERPGDFLRSRLNGWFSDEAQASMTDVREPPRPGQTFEAWFAASRRRARDEGGDRPRPQLSETGVKAREEVREFAASRRRDPLARLRESERRRAEALESLKVRGGEPARDAVVPVAPREARATPRMVAGFAGRQSFAARSPQVVRIVDRLRAEKRGPSKAELAVLRNAVRDAHHTAGLGTLQAASAEVSDEGGALTPEGARIRAFLDRADGSSLPLDAMVAILTLAVDSPPEEPFPPRD